MKLEVSAAVIQERSTRLLHMAVALSIAALLIAFFRWILLDWFTVFFEPLLEGFTWLCLLLLTLICLARIAIYRRKKFTAELKAVGLALATLLTLYFVPFTSLGIKMNFATFRKSREAVVPCLLSKSCGSPIRVGSRGELFALPTGSKHVSSGGGEVIIDHQDGRDYILFFYFRGLPNQFSGYVYSPSDTPPAKDQFHGHGAEIDRVAPHWYWYVS